MRTLIIASLLLMAGTASASPAKESYSGLLAHPSRKQTMELGELRMAQATPDTSPRGETPSPSAQTGTTTGVTPSNSTNSDRSQPTAAAGGAAAEQPQVARTDRGSVGSGSGSNTGLFVWVFILVGNAIALCVLNGVGGPTSAMGRYSGPHDFQRTPVSR
jgi:hypothetical protein